MDYPREVFIMPSDKVNICLVLKTGGDYTMEYVFKLVEGIRRNTTRPNRITLLTDSHACEIPIGISVFPLKRGFAGWWSKLEIFDYFVNKKTVYIDLDTVINDNIDWLLKIDSKFAMLSDLMKPQFAASGIMLFNGDFRFLANGFKMEMEKDFKRTGNWGDQGYISKELGLTPERIQNYKSGEIASYKKSNPNDKKRASIICYHGKPRPHHTGWAV